MNREGGVHMRRIAWLVVALLVGCPMALAAPKGTSRRSQHNGASQQTTPQPQSTTNVPPGISKKGSLPKGLEKQGKTPKGWEKGKKKGWFGRH